MNKNNAGFLLESSEGGIGVESSRDIQSVPHFFRDQAFAGSFNDLTNEIRAIFPGFQGFVENVPLPAGWPARFNPATNQIEFAMSFSQTTRGLVAEEVRHALDVAAGFNPNAAFAAFQQETGVVLVQNGTIAAGDAQIRQFQAWHHRRVYTRLLQDADRSSPIMNRIVGPQDVDSIYELYQLEAFGRSSADIGVDW